MEYIEYPKSLYRKGEEQVVDDVEQEDAARADGWTDFLTDRDGAQGAAEPPSGGATAAEATRKPGRPRKAQ